MFRLAISLLLALVAAPLAAQTAEQARNPYLILREANRMHDAAVAASAYTRDAALIFDYSGRPRESHRGRKAILKSYEAVFASVDGRGPIDLNFKLDPPTTGAPDRQSGVYRVVVGSGSDAIRAFGRFTVKLREEEGQWLFAEDSGREATAADYEAIAAAPMFPDRTS